MVIITFEFAQEHDIPSENPGFKAYKYGPYTYRIDRALQTLDELGYLYSVGRLNTNSERFYLTDKGLAKGEELLSKFDEKTRTDLRMLKTDLQQLPLNGLENRVYSDYPHFTEKSEIFHRVLHRRRTQR